MLIGLRIAAALAGDVDQLAGLFAPNIEWRGVTTGHLWWRRSPVCRGAAEAEATLRRWLQSVDATGGRVDAGVVAAGGDRVIVELQWFADASASSFRVYEVVTFKGTEIVDMQDCSSREDAFDVAGLAAGG